MNIRDAQQAYDHRQPQEWDAVSDIATEHLCDSIAENWVKAGGDVALWIVSHAEIALMVERGEGGEVGMLGDVAEEWRKGGGDADGFRRNAREIQGWIGAHLSAYGRYKRILW